MRVRATVRFRNEEMLATRKSKGLTQAQLATVAGCTTNQVQAFERFDYAFGNLIIRTQAAQQIAEILSLDIDTVLPHSMDGRYLRMDAVEIKDVPLERLLSTSQESQRLAIEGADEQFQKKHDSELLKSKMDKALDRLTYREKLIVQMYLGIDGSRWTFPEIAPMFRLCTQSVVMIFNKAIRKLRKLATIEDLKGFIPDYFDGMEVEEVFHKLKHVGADKFRHYGKGRKGANRAH